VLISGIYGVVHLPALPGDPRSDGEGFAAVYDRAMADAQALVAGGCAGIVIENFGSAPFCKGSPDDRAPPHQLAALTVVATRCRERFDVPIGINVLRNDGPAALGVAAATDAAFVRINVHVGAYVTDQGLIEGEAAHTLRYRSALAARSVGIWADVLVKHATPLAPVSATDATKDCVHRGLADAVIVTGNATGGTVSRDDLAAVADAAHPAAVVIGSGLTPERIDELAPLAHAAIVGTYLKRDGDVAAPVDEARVRALVDAARGRFRS